MNAGLSPFARQHLPARLFCAECAGQGVTNDLWHQQQMLCWVCAGTGASNPIEAELWLLHSEIKIVQCEACTGQGIKRCDCCGHEEECWTCSTRGCHLSDGTAQIVRVYRLPRHLHDRVERLLDMATC